MGLDPITANSGAVALISIIGTIVISRFALRRFREVPSEYRFATYPTILVAIAFIFLALGGISGILDAFLPIGDIVQYRVTMTMIMTASLMLTLASLWAIEKRVWSIPIFIFYTIGAVAIWVSPTVPISGIFMILMVTAISVLSFGPAILFGYLWFTSKPRKTTIFSLFIGILLISIAGTIRGMSALLPVVFVLNWMGLFGYAIITVAFLIPEQKFGGEFFGYTIAIVVMSAMVVWTLMWWDLVTFDILLFTGATQIAAGFSVLSAAFLWGRYKQSPHMSTGLLLGFFVFIAAGYILYVLDNFRLVVLELQLILPPVIGTLGTYLGFVGVAFVAASAIYAIEWRTLTLLPFLIAIPLTIIAVLFFPDLAHNYSIFPANVFWWSTVGLLSMFFMIPIGLYLLLWWRLRDETTSGRGKPLGLAIGLLLIFPAHITFVPIEIRSALRIISFVILMLALTGWLDRLLDRGKVVDQS
jgi:hypothetical protein